MAGQALTTASTLLCPHGGSVSIVTSNTRTSAGAPMVRSTDTFLVSGCAFSTPAGPSPCLTVQWIVADTRVTVAGGATLSTGSVGLCKSGAGVPQGPVSIVSTQPHASTV